MYYHACVLCTIFSMCLCASLASQERPSVSLSQQTGFAVWFYKVAGTKAFHNVKDLKGAGKLYSSTSSHPLLCKRKQRNVCWDVHTIVRRWWGESIALSTSELWQLLQVNLQAQNEVLSSTWSANSKSSMHTPKGWVAHASNCNGDYRLVTIGQV